jgi:hypothetical protein
MKYFILYTAVKEEDPFSMEYYIKGKCKHQVLRQIQEYSNGLLTTSHFGICTRNIQNGYLREIQLNDFPELSPKNFSLICESKCLSY